VQRITGTAVVVVGQEYEVDCIIYASGFEVGTSYTRRSGYEVTGRDGGTLSDYWADGMRTLHGIHAHGFPNVFIVQPAQGANLISNVPHNIVDSARTIAVTIRHVLDNGFAAVEPSTQAEEAWITLLLSGPGSAIGGPDCTPGYYKQRGPGRGTRGMAGPRVSLRPERLLRLHRPLADIRHVRRTGLPMTGKLAGQRGGQGVMRAALLTRSAATATCAGAPN
jgi:hypothetical protein